MSRYVKPSKGTQKYDSLAEALIGKTKHGFQSLEMLKVQRELVRGILWGEEDVNILDFITNVKEEKMELTRKQLELMVKGSQLKSYSHMDNPAMKKCGYYTGGFVDSWSWNSNLSDVPTEDLETVIDLCN